MAMSARTLSDLRVPCLRDRIALAALFMLVFALPAHAQVCNAPNLARSATATAQTTYPGYSAARTNDGDRSTALGGGASWVNDRGTAAVLDLALPVASQVDRVQLFTTSGYELRDYDIQLRVGGGWTTVQSIRGNAAVQRDHRFAARFADAVRVVGLSGPLHQMGYSRVNELEIYNCGGVSTGNVQGFVVRYGRFTALPNVVVSLGGTYFTTTDASGFYRFTGVPSGSYTIRATRAGWTFGSQQFQNDNYTVTIVGGTLGAPTIIGYDRNPIVYATGWTDNFHRFEPVKGTLTQEGYLPVDAQIETSLLYTPPFWVNALNVRDAVQSGRHITGQPRAIVFGHSMGGVVSRRYVESGFYRGDVSQLYTFGSPHYGAPMLTSLVCLPNQPAVCEMSKPSMMLFNAIHHQRPGIGYHALGGDAPMWKQHRICFRIFRRRICIGSIPLPTFEFRSGLGWAMGVLIPGADDGLIQTYSSTGLPGILDRMTTQEVHIATTLGSRDYYRWDSNSNVSAQSYWNCVRPILVVRNTSTCGQVSFRPPFILASLKAALRPGAAAAQDEFPQRSRNVRSTLNAGVRIERDVFVDGSPTLFSATWEAGDASVTLVDPTGQVFDPAFAAGVLDAEPVPGDPESDERDPNMVLYSADATIATYHFLAPRPGRWKLIVVGGTGIPAGGTSLQTLAAFKSDLGVAFANDFPFYLTGTGEDIVLTSTGPMFSGEAQVTVRRFDGRVDAVTMTRRADGAFQGTYTVPDAPGVAEVSWFVTGIDAGGRTFERAGSDEVQINRRTLAVEAVAPEVAIIEPSDPKRYAALDVSVRVRADYAGAAIVSADLVDGAGNLVAGASELLDVVVGVNNVTLRFAGEDIAASRRDGPYRVTNVITADQRESAILSDWLLDQWVTAAHNHRLFGPPAPTACGTQNVLRGAFASATSTYAGYSPARTTDGDRNTALGEAYSWSNARETGDTAALPASLEIALPGRGVVDQILVYSTAGWEIRDYDLEYFDGAEWTVIEQVRGNARTVREHRIPPTSIAALRIVGHSGPDHQQVHVRINEVEGYLCQALPNKSKSMFTDLRTKYATYAR